MPDTYLALEIAFKAPGNHEAVSGVLFLAGCVGIYEQSPTHWIAYFPETAQRDTLLALQQRLVHQFADQIQEVKEHQVANQDWNARWRQYFKPLQITPTLWVRPPWEVLPPAARGIELIIQPQMGFGTGHHETTRLMLEWMMELPLENKRVLDVGTGSGILAILASKRGAAGIVAIDIDADAIENARENMDINRIRNVHLQVGDIHTVPREAFDVILANIQLPVLQQMGESFSHRLAPNGILLVSGLLDRDAGKLQEAYARQGMEFRARRTLGEWVAELYQKQGEAK